MKKVNLFKRLSFKKTTLASSPEDGGLLEENHAPRIYESENELLNYVYGKVTQYMDERKPYLDGDFTLDELARRLYMNRAKLSRAINVCSGFNFSQFLNWYRVKHATQLMKKDPRLKVNEIAKYSGFNTQPSFNMAFRLFERETPSEYMRHIKKRSVTLLSSPRREAR